MVSLDPHTTAPDPRSATPVLAPAHPVNAQTGDAGLAAATWRALATLLAGKQRVRISRDGGRNYHRRWERTLTDELPHQPAAVPLYTQSGECRVLVIDLDTSKGGSDAVRRDAAAITQLVHQAGGQLIRDHSPNGGVHLYIPLATPVGFLEARDLAVALATRTPTMDPTPNHNLTDGLIRPPGSRHRTGGFQTLDGPLDRAYHVARTGNPPSVMTHLRESLRDELQNLARRVSQPLLEAPTGEPATRHRQLTATYAQIAATGRYDTRRYASPSEARHAVITSAVAAGFTLPDIQRRVLNGTWPGLAALYARYRPTTRLGAIARDHHKARTWLTHQPTHAPTEAPKTVHKSHTSEHISHRAAPTPLDSSSQLTDYQWIRRWENAVRSAELQRYPGRGGYGLRFLLRALGEAARKRGSRRIDFGVRSLAIATGLDHGTVARYLSRLRKEDQPFVRLSRDHHGLDADQYELVIPDADQDRSERQAWKPGKTSSLRPAFRELGHVPALIYEAIEHSPTALSTMKLIDRTRISRAAVHDALDTLAAFNLVHRTQHGWTRNTTANLADLAEQLGCTDAVHQQISRYTMERTLWRALVMSGRYFDSETFTDPAAWIPWPEHPPDDNHSLLDLLPH